MSANLNFPRQPEPPLDPPDETPRLLPFWQREPEADSEPQITSATEALWWGGVDR